MFLLESISTANTVAARSVPFTKVGKHVRFSEDHLREIHNLAQFDLAEIQHFFQVYKELEPGKSVEGATWVGRAEAEAEILLSRERQVRALADGGTAHPTH